MSRPGSLPITMRWWLDAHAARHGYDAAALHPLAEAATGRKASAASVRSYVWLVRSNATATPPDADDWEELSSIRRDLAEESHAAREFFDESYR